MRYRLATATDLPATLQLLRRHPTFVAPPQTWEAMLAVWRTWLAAEQMSVVVWEDLRLPPAERLLAVGMSVMVSDEFAESVITSGEPYPARRLYDTADTPESPVLTLDQIARANAGDGVNVFMLHNPMRVHDLADPSQKELLPLGPQAWYFSHAGYYVRTVLWECYGQQHIDYLVGGGFALLSSYRRGHPDLLEAGTQFRPFLGGLRRPPELDSGYDPIRLWMFNRVPPRLAFNAAQQRLLRFALLGYTDRELEALLATSANTLKQRWHRIFEQMAKVFPQDAFDPAATLDPVSVGASARRLPKRHHVLDYVRQNMHELRPHG